MAYAYAPGHMLGMTDAYPSLTMLSGIDVEGDLEFLNQNRRGWDMRRGPSNLRMLHHHPFESYEPVMDNVPDCGILPPGHRPSRTIQLHNIPIINLHHHNTLPLATAGVVWIGSTTRSGMGKRNVVGSSLLIRLYLTPTTSFLLDRYLLFTSTPMGH